jgi:protein-L-isoaspartate(D-aspartate) O-methyltransferase
VFEVSTKNLALHISRVAFSLAFLACSAPQEDPMPSQPASPESALSRRSLEQRRHAMVSAQIEARGVKDARVLAALRSVPRHAFVPEELRAAAYEDRPLPIGFKATISQPYMVAVMTELLQPQPGDRILEVGTGSGYQAAVLSGLVREVVSIEIVPELAERARQALREQGFDNVEVITGDGYAGHPPGAPYDGIVVTAAPKQVPEALVEQLAVGGRLVIPVGGFWQELEVLEKTETGIERRELFPVRFVPLVHGDE